MAHYCVRLNNGFLILALNNIQMRTSLDSGIPLLFQVVKSKISPTTKSVSATSELYNSQQREKQNANINPMLVFCCALDTVMSFCCFFFSLELNSKIKMNLELIF